MSGRVRREPGRGIALATCLGGALAWSSTAAPAARAHAAAPGTVCIFRAGTADPTDETWQLIAVHLDPGWQPPSKVVSCRRHVDGAWRQVPPQPAPSGCGSGQARLWGQLAGPQLAAVLRAVGPARDERQISALAAGWAGLAAVAAWSPATGSLGVHLQWEQASASRPVAPRCAPLAALPAALEPGPAAARPAAWAALRARPGVLWRQQMDLWAKVAPIGATVAALQVAALEDAHGRRIAEDVLGLEPATWRWGWAEDAGWLGCLPMADAAGGLALLADGVAQLAQLWPTLRATSSGAQGPVSLSLGRPGSSLRMATSRGRWLAAAAAKDLPRAEAVACAPRARPEAADPRLEVDLIPAAWPQVVGPFARLQGRLRATARGGEGVFLWRAKK